MTYKRFLLIFMFQLPFIIFSQIYHGENEKNESELSIRKVLSDQVTAWNKGEISAYMLGYWKSDSLMFIGKSGIQYGWQKTLDGYKKSYPDKETMGFLTFSEISVDLLSKESAYVIGKWALAREKGNIGGIFTLLFKRIDGNWFIVCDHTS